MKNWIDIKKKQPKENEEVWLFNETSLHVAIGCLCWTGEQCGWVWAVPDGYFFNNKGKIATTCHISDDYAFTHWQRLPVLPMKTNINVH